MSVLIDTSVWVDHFRNHNAALVNLLHQDRVLTHPMVILEIACGAPPTPRQHTLRNLALLQSCPDASWSDLLEFIERERLHGQGCGLVDMSLLAATVLRPGTELWTLDRRLQQLAQRFGVAHQPA